LYVCIFSKIFVWTDTVVLFFIFGENHFYINLTISCSVSWKLIIPFHVYRIFICEIVYCCTQAWKGGEEKKCLACSHQFVHVLHCNKVLWWPCLYMCMYASDITNLPHWCCLLVIFFWVSFTLCCLIISDFWIPQERIISCLHLKRKRNFMGLPTDFGDYHCLPDVSYCIWQYKSRQAVAAIFIT